MKVFVWALSTLVIAVLSAAPARSSNDDRSPARIANPAQAPSLRTVHLKELWRVGGDTEAEGEVFGTIADLAVDSDGNVYILDQQFTDVRMFSPDGVYLRSIGREGEGPGEFRQPNGLVMTPANQIGVFQSHPIKLTLFERNGNPAGDLNFEMDPEHSIQFLGGVHCGRDSFLVSGMNVNATPEAIDQVHLLLRFSAAGKFVCELARTPRRIDLVNFVLREERAPYAAFGADGTAYLSRNWDYEITVSNRDCGVDRVITREYEHRRRTRDEVAAIESRYRRGGGTQGATFDISKYDRDIRWIDVDGSDRIWILSSRGFLAPSENCLGVFDVYNASGKTLVTLDLRGEGSPETDRYFLVENRLYVVRHVRAARNEKIEEAEPMSVICYQLPGL